MEATIRSAERLVKAKSQTWREARHIVALGAAMEQAIGPESLVGAYAGHSALSLTS